MATSDRLYEVACDCRDLEESIDRLKRDLRDKDELVAAFGRAAGELLEALEDARLSGGYPPPAGVARAASDLRSLTS